MGSLEMKTVLNTFFDITVTVHIESIPQGQAVNKAYYVEILTRFREAVRRKIPELWPKYWILHHDYAAVHKELPVKHFVPKNTFFKLNTHPISLIWLRMTSGCFQK
jgi:hypothetical protein